MTILADARNGFGRREHRGRKRRTLKHSIPLAATLLLSIVLVACGDTGEPDVRAEPPMSAATPAVAGQSQATAENPASVGGVRGLAVDSATGDPIAVTPTGLARWAGANQGWEPIVTSTDLDWENVDGVVVNPDDPANLYIFGISVGILRSDNDGRDWKAVTAGLPGDDIGALAIHTNRRDTLFAWIDGQGVFRTEDGGEQWEMMDEGPDSSTLRTLAHSPLEGSMNTGWLYAATPEGIYLSMDCF